MSFFTFCDEGPRCDLSDTRQHIQNTVSRCPVIPTFFPRKSYCNQNSLFVPSYLVVFILSFSLILEPLYYQHQPRVWCGEEANYEHGVLSITLSSSLFFPVLASRYGTHVAGSPQGLKQKDIESKRPRRRAKQSKQSGDREELRGRISNQKLWGPSAATELSHGQRHFPQE